jgi:predicted transcriptional regulator
MRKSKLEAYQEILEVLMRKPLTIDSLAYETSTECAVLRQRLDFLIRNGLVKEQVLGERTLCTIADRGIAVLKALNTQKQLEKVKDAIITSDRTAQAVSTIPSPRRKAE